MMEAVRTSQTSVDNHFTRQYIPEDNSEYLYVVFFQLHSSAGGHDESSHGWDVPPGAVFNVFRCVFCYYGKSLHFVPI
jgi:hypothetical protein